MSCQHSHQALNHVGHRYCVDCGEVVGTEPLTKRQTSEPITKPTTSEPLHALPAGEPLKK